MNKKFEIFIDSTGELNREYREKYDIDYLPMGVSFDDKEIPASLDYDQGYSIHDFYQYMREGKRIFTSQVKETSFVEKWKPLLEKGLDILYIACSGALSQSVNAGRVVAERLLADYPDRKIICFNSKISCCGQADMAIRASKMREEGKSIEETYAWLRENRLKFNQFATVDSLTYLKQAGRVKASSAFFGNLFKVHPILISDAKGNNFAISKIKGKKAAIKELVRLAVEAAEDIEHQTVYIAHADDPAVAEEVKAELLSLAKPQEIAIFPFGPIIGASTGPGTIGIFLFGKEVTTNLEA